MTTPTGKSDESFAQSAKACFDASVEQLDAATLSRLNRGRQAALAAARGPEHPVLTRWLPASGVLAAALLAAVMWPAPSGNGALPLQQDGEVELLLTDDSLDMLEDLDFYAWMQALEKDVTQDAG